MLACVNMQAQQPMPTVLGVLTEAYWDLLEHAPVALRRSSCFFCCKEMDVKKRVFKVKNLNKYFKVKFTLVKNFTSISSLSHAIRMDNYRIENFTLVFV